MVDGSSGTFLSGQGTLVNVLIHVRTNAPFNSTSVLDFTDFAYNNGIPCVSTHGGTVHVPIPTAAISGNVFYHGNAIPLGGVTLDIEPGSNGVTTSSGAYQFPNLPYPNNYTISPVRSSGPECSPSITFYDASLAARHALGLITLDSVKQR